MLILADDLGYGDLGCYGREDVETPHLDAMAAGGLRFTDYHSNGAVCSPTRAALMTGRYQQRCGIEGVVTAARHRDTGMPLAEVTVAETLKAAGYRTALLGKWHLGYEPKWGPNAQGFDEFRGFVSGNVDYKSHIDQEGHIDWWRDTKLEPEEGYLTELLTQHAVEFIKANRERPFFLYIPHGAPHYPIQGPDDPAIRSPGKPNRQKGDRASFLVGYQRMLKSLDASVGATIKAVEEAGLAERTLIIFVSDNGPSQRYGGSSGRLRGFKGNLFEGGHRVPAIAYQPSKIKPSVTQHTAMGFDWFATFAAMANATVSEDRSLDGVDLSGLLYEQKPLSERTLYWSKSPGATALREGPWKLIAGPGKPQLFNLADDLGEKNDLSATKGKVLERLLRKTKTWDKEVRAKVERRS